MSLRGELGSLARGETHTQAAVTAEIMVAGTLLTYTDNFLAQSKQHLNAFPHQQTHNPPFASESIQAPKAGRLVSKIDYYYYYYYH